MAVTTGIYYHEINNQTGNNTKYRIYFIAGDTLNITQDDYTSLTKMPGDFILSCKLNRQFDNDLPVGQELASILELKLNLNSGTFNSAAFSTFKTQILAQESSSQVIAWVNPKDSTNVYFNIPNRWFISYSTDNWMTYGICWDGFQERIKEYKINSDGIIVINVIDTATTILRNISIETIGYDIHNSFKGVNTYCADELIYYYSDYLGKRYHISNSSTDWNPLEGDAPLKYLHVSFLNNFIDKCAYYSQTLLTSFRRGIEYPSMPLFIYRGSPLTHWTFYEQNVNNAHDETTLTQILDEGDIRIINSVYFTNADNVILGGCNSDSKSEGSWGQEYKNLHNLFKALSENFFCKSYFNYHIGTINFVFMPIFDYNFHISDPGTISIDSSNITKDWKIIYGTDMEQSIAHIHNANDEDITEISVKNSNMGIDEGSYEINCILHNNFCNPRLNKYTENQKDDWNEGNLRRMPTIATTTQCLFYYNENMDNEADEKRIGKLAEYCKINIGQNTLVVSENYCNIYDVIGFLNDITSTCISVTKNIGLDRQTMTGTPYTAVKAANSVFNTRYQGFIEFNARINTINIQDLGRLLAINFSDITSIIKLNTDIPNAVITNLEWDLFSEYIKVKAFIKG